jgi:S1-C subfamily serine protease
VITPIPEDTSEDVADSEENGEEDTDKAEPTPTPVIVEQSIDATLDDYTAMYEEMRQLSYESSKSLLEVTGFFTVTDWLFDTSAEQTVSSTGMIVGSNSTEYLVLASLDRIKDANSVKIKFSDTAYVDATVLDYESELNIALLSVVIEDIPTIYRTALQVADLGESNTITVGTPVIALGNPNGYIDSMEVGIVTSRGSYANITDNRMELFTTDMDFNKNSDGIIINMRGRVVGWITRTVEDENNPDVSAIIGISKLIPIIYQMGYQQPRIYFGIYADDITTDIKQQHNITNGIYVSEVQADSPAFNAGLKNGDIILYINEQAILNTNNFYNTIASFKADDEITVTVLRTSGTTDREVILTVTLTEKVQ